MSRFQPSRNSDDAWEDVPNDTGEDDVEVLDDLPDRSTPTGSPQGSSSGSRRRRPLQRKVYIAAPRAGSARPSSTRQREAKRNVTEDVSDALRDGGIESARYIGGVLKIALRFMKHPLGILFALWAIAWIVDLVANSLRASLAPMCALPGIALLCPAFLTNAPNSSRRGMGKSKVPPPKWADFPRLVDMQDRTFEMLLDETIDGNGVSLEVKKAEMATADLVTLIRVSDLASRDRLADMLNLFVDDARDTAQLLQRLSAQVSGTVDSVVAINDYTLHTIQAARDDANSISSSLYALVPFIHHTVTNPDEVVKKTFAHSLDLLSRDTGKLLLLAQDLKGRLDRLETRLGSVHELVAREDSSLAEARDELLAQLWTKLGGNQKTLRGMETHSALLRGVGVYRTRALAQVVSTIQALNALQADLEVLRERVAAPALTGDTIPVEVHVRSIGAGLKRLQERNERQEKERHKISEKALRDAADLTLEAKA